MKVQCDYDASVRELINNKSYNKSLNVKLPLHSSTTTPISYT